MEENTVFYILVGALVWALIMAWIISSATQTAKKLKYDEKKIRLLILACKKIGASEDEIAAAMKT